jgi:hypothetical protein
MLLGNAQEDPVTVFRIRIRRIRMFLGLLDPDPNPDPVVRGLDPEKVRKTLIPTAL